MANAIYHVPHAVNEPILSYAPGSKERALLKATLSEMKSHKRDIPMYIGGKEVYTGDKQIINPPHELNHSLGSYHRGSSKQIEDAIQAAQDAKPGWSSMPWEERAAIFLKAAELLSGPFRARMNAATMLCQSKNVFQAEIDCVAELVDFYRFNVQYMTKIYSEQPENASGIWNRLEYRPLEGFVFALTPFNFTSIAGNLPGAPALMGNTVVWKPARSQIYSASVIMEILMVAGLPDGVINLVYVDGSSAGKVIFSHPDFGGLHFTGSTEVFQSMWKTIGNNISSYRSYPRIVGETGGKDFVVAHSSADPVSLATALTRGAFEYQGQKCSAASRAYIPRSLWKSVKEKMKDDLNSITMGSPEDFSHFVNAVIDEKAYNKITGYIAGAKNDGLEFLSGGNYSKESGYYIEPTVIVAQDPKHVTMCEEIFGPVLSVYVYEDTSYSSTLKTVDRTSPYALTGSIFAQDRHAIIEATEKLSHAAGNFYINDKPTGAVVGQQPFGGARSSGTNDKAGSVLNLYRWVSPRTLKENFNPPVDYQYPFMAKE
jgi:1-pyrroline-5-carboxylate dehydrogenase